MVVVVDNTFFRHCVLGCAGFIRSVDARHSRNIATVGNSYVLVFVGQCIFGIPKKLIIHAEKYPQFQKDKKQQQSEIEM